MKFFHPKQALYMSPIESGGLFFVLYDTTTPFTVDKIRGCLEMSLATVHGTEQYFVSKVYANHGYGPLMYLIAAHYSNSQGLTCDLGGAVSPGSERVWKLFYQGASASYVRCHTFNHPVRWEPWFNIRLLAHKKPPGLCTALQQHKKNQKDSKRMVQLSTSFLNKVIDPFRPASAAKSIQSALAYLSASNKYKKKT